METRIESNEYIANFKPGSDIITLNEDKCHFYIGSTGEFCFLDGDTCIITRPMN